MMYERCGLKLLGLVLVNLISLSLAKIQVRTIDWVLQETLFTKLCSTKSMLTVNNMFPGPALHLHQGERIRVNVHNQGKFGVTIHWHGVKQPRNPWSDGPEYVTQCPIKPGGNYTYEIILSDEEGTLWWHAHSDWSRATVHGPIFIYPKPGKHYPYHIKPHKEIPIFLASWYKGDVMQNIKDALASGGETNKSDAFTINGQPGNTQPCSTKDMFTMTVEYGRTYLLRIINGVMNEEMFFMVANHKLVVVGIDASYIKPITTNYIMITPGQTMDVLIKANQNPSHYYMAARAFGVVFSNATTTALLRYIGDHKSPPKTALPNLPYYNDNDASIAFTRRFRALKNDENFPLNVDKRILMTLAVETLPCEKGKVCSGPNNEKTSASFNNVTFEAPSKIDILQGYWKHLKNVFKTDFPERPPYVFNYTMSPMIGNEFLMSDLNGTRVIVIDYNATVEIVLQGTNVLNGSENHPIHLHGYSFYVVGWGKGIFDEDKSPLAYNMRDPVKVNTIGVPKNGWTAIRFKAYNPGVWFMHCHLERHASWGMDMVIVVKNGPSRATSIRPPHFINPC